MLHHSRSLKFCRYGTCLIVVLQLTAIPLVLYFLFHHENHGYSRLQIELKQLQIQNSKLHANVTVLSEKLSRTWRNQSGSQISSQKMRTGGGYGMDQKDNDDDMELDECEVIHIAMVVSGSIQKLIVVVKSILFYRQNFLHFHFLTDGRDRKILSTVFETWLLPMVNVSFYSIADVTHMVKGIPNSHYLGIFALTKLTLPMILPNLLHAVIVLDTNLMFVADIGSLWMMLRRLREEKQQLGLVENQSNLYLGNTHKLWAANGRGFHMGVILLNLDLMRERNWNETLHLAAKESLVTYNNTTLVDQDIINAAAKREGDLIFTLPCVWNVQLTKNTRSEYCNESAHHFKVISWKSASKPHGPHFRNLYAVFENYESSLFRTHLSDCPFETSFSSLVTDADDNDTCLELRNEAQLVNRIHPFYLDFLYNSDGENDVTFVSQMSMDRLHMLEPLCKHWGGPLSIALYASDADLKRLTSIISASPFLNDFKKLALHVVFEEGKVHPLNHLRNVALNAAITPYVFLSDIDFLPVPNLYHYTKKFIKILGSNRRALVIPAFESLLDRIDFPSNKIELISMLKKEKVIPFHFREWKPGQSPTDFDRWKQAKQPYRVRWMDFFEPYVVVRQNVTRYDERFVGRGYDKVSHIMELYFQGYEFVVLPEAFILHMPHPPSADVAKFRHKTFRDCMEVVMKGEFRKELVKKYGHRGKSQKGRLFKQHTRLIYPTPPRKKFRFRWSKPKKWA